ncbi:MAG: phospholipase D family protein [Planctomycetes bacterium]|nr:phospholipase D family protein [Planctomycetota bacterium]
MPTQFLSSPRQIRAHLKLYCETAERIDIFVAAFCDEKLTLWLCKAAKRGAQVNITTDLTVATSADDVAHLQKAGVNVGVFSPSIFAARDIEQFHPKVYIFDSETDWWTAAIVGSFDATQESIANDLEAAMLCESSTFNGKDDAGETILQLLDWSDCINHKPIDKVMAKTHRQKWDKAQHTLSITGSSHRVDQVIEIKPGHETWASPLSWQQLRNCEWGTYFKALLETQNRRKEQVCESLTGPKGWLAGINFGSDAFNTGPEKWSDPAINTNLFGMRGPSGWMGKVTGAGFRAFIRDDRAYAKVVFTAIRRCAAEPTAGTIRHALSPLMVRDGVTMADLSRFLACAAPDHFVSIADESVQHRLSDVVGFDLTSESRDRFDHLVRYSHAIEQIHTFPWVSTPDAERTSTHSDEPDAWSKRVALLGSFVS